MWLDYIITIRIGWHNLVSLFNYDIPSFFLVTFEVPPTVTYFILWFIQISRYPLKLSPLPILTTIWISRCSFFSELNRLWHVRPYWSLTHFLRHHWACSVRSKCGFCHGDGRGESILVALNFNCRFNIFLLQILFVVNAMLVGRCVHLSDERLEIEDRVTQIQLEISSLVDGRNFH